MANAMSKRHAIMYKRCSKEDEVGVRLVSVDIPWCLEWFSLVAWCDWVSWNWMAWCCVISGKDKS